MIYKTFFLCTGIRYPNINDYYNFDENIQYWQLELHEQLNELSREGWELVQLSEGLLNGNEVCGYGFFRRTEPVINAQWQYYKNNGVYYVFFCTNCGRILKLSLDELDLDDTPKDFIYCPRCGERMKKP